MLGSALAGLIGAALVTACFYLLLVLVSFFVPLPGARSAILVTGLLLGVFLSTFTVAFRKLAGDSRA